MTMEEIKTIMKVGRIIHKSLTEIIEALNTVDSAKVLKKLDELRSDNYWRPFFGPEAECPGPEHGCVLVKIRDDPKFFEGANGEVYSLPHIAEFSRSDGNWWPQEWDDHYGTEKVPFEVVYWRPLPEATYAKIFADEEVVGRDRTYE